MTGGLTDVAYSGASPRRAQAFSALAAHSYWSLAEIRLRL